MITTINALNTNGYLYVFRIIVYEKPQFHEQKNIMAAVGTNPKYLHTTTIKLAILVFVTSLPSPSHQTSHCACADPYSRETGSDVERAAVSHEGGNEDGLVVYLAALVPHDSSHPFSLARARPAVDEAVLQLQKRGIFKRDTIKVM